MSDIGPSWSSFQLKATTFYLKISKKHPIFFEKNIPIFLLYFGEDLVESVLIDWAQILINPLPDDKTRLLQIETNCRRHFKMHSK